VTFRDGDIADSLELGLGQRLSVLADSDGFAAVPMIHAGDGSWRRAGPGDGVAESVLRLLATTTGTEVVGAFTVVSWSTATARGERAVGVDQTNESVIVGDAAVVKWATHPSGGPHPAPQRISVLRRAGFTGMPTPWGFLTWQPPRGPHILLATVDAYLPGAVDGWTWAVELITAAAQHGSTDPLIAAARDIGALLADMHGALSSTATIASPADATRWHHDALNTLQTACRYADSAAGDYARRHRQEIADVFATLGELAGTPVLDGHGDLHVGQVLRSSGRFYITDFDGNPVLSAAERMRPIPAVLDTAGMVQSLAHATIVARKYTELDAAVSATVDAMARSELLDAYRTRLHLRGDGELFDSSGLRAFRIQQVLREIVYAARHLPRWMYVPDAALPALLEERGH